jgi:hypothetical protein
MTTPYVLMKCAPSAADRRNSAIAGLMVRCQASSASNAPVPAAIISAKPAMNNAPRAVAISGSAANAVHSGPLHSTAIQSAAPKASVSGLQRARSPPRGSEAGLVRFENMRAIVPRAT